HEYNQQDVAFAMELANRAAMAIENARLYRETQAALREKEKALTLLRTVLQQLPSGVIIAEAPDATLLLRNQFATEFWKSTAALPDAIDQKTKMFRAFHPDGSPFQPEDWPLIRSLRHGELVVGEEMEVVKLTGERSIIRTSAAPIRDAEGRTIAAAVSFEDVTARLLA